MAYEFFIGDVAFGAALSFLAGILAVSLGWNIAVLTVAMCLGGFVWLAWMKFGGWLIAMLLIIPAVFALGAFYYHFFTTRISQENLPIGKSVSFSAIIDDQPKQSGKYVLLSVGMEKPYGGIVTIFAPPGSDFHYGDELRITGEIAAPKMMGDSPAVFSQKLTLIAKHKGFWLREKLINFKLGMLAKLNEVLPADAAALLGGETLGDANNMSTDLKNEMTASGTSYIVSMYGYKISMVIFFLEEMLKEIIARRIRFLILIGAVILFVMMAGGQPSVVRAAVMSILVVLATAAGRVFDSRNALALTAAGMAMFDPTLVVQAGFQLSFLSIAGIKYLSVPLKNMFGWERKGAGIIGWREAIVIAVASLLPIIPIIANAFGNFSLVTFPSNILISLGVLPAMIAGVVLAFAASVSYYVAFFIAKFVSIILWYQLVVIKICAIAAPFVQLPISFGSPLVFLGYYAALAWFIYYYAEES